MKGLTMTNEEVIEKIKDICDGYTVENDCPFFDKELDKCKFSAYGLGIPFEWNRRADDEDI